jgi:HSP20 family protein
MAMLPSRREWRGPLSSFRREVDRLFDNFFGSDWGLLPAESSETGRFPVLDMTETEDAVKVTAEVPGMKAEEIDISVSGDTLAIKGEKKEEKEEKKGAVHRVERRYGRFERSVRLPAECDVDKATASYKDGLLTIELPKKEEAKAKSTKIEVK